jgi:hypothetical protein
MYLNAPEFLGQPQKEPSREELDLLLALCRRDELMATRSSDECDQALAVTERVLEDTMKDLARCRTRLDAAQRALKAARKRAGAAKKHRPAK